MSGDGAHLGFGAEAALNAVVGGEQPDPESAMSAAEMSAWIREAKAADATSNYNECARFAARLVLEWLLADPARANGAVETEYDWQGDPDHGAHGCKPEYLTAVGWYDQMKADGFSIDGVSIDDLGLSGFMWGWAANAARRCVELPPVPNPAIVEIG